MIILALDSSTEACSVAINNNGKISEDFRIAPRQQANLLLPMIDALLKQNNIALSQIDLLAFGCGPGSFTGLRIAAGVIQGLAFSLNIPVIPISTLHAMAQYAYQQYKVSIIIPCIDARMNEVYCGYYQADGQLVKSTQADKLAMPDAIYHAEAKTALAVGDGWQVYQQLIINPPEKIIADCYPHASAIAYLAAALYEHVNTVTAEQVQPVYLRNKVTN